MFDINNLPSPSAAGETYTTRDGTAYVSALAGGVFVWRLSVQDALTAAQLADINRIDAIETAKQDQITGTSSSITIPGAGTGGADLTFSGGGGGTIGSDIVVESVAGPELFNGRAFDGVPEIDFASNAGNMSIRAGTLTHYEGTWTAELGTGDLTDVLPGQFATDVTGIAIDNVDANGNDFGSILQRGTALNPTTEIEILSADTSSTIISRALISAYQLSTQAGDDHTILLLTGYSMADFPAGTSFTIRLYPDNLPDEGQLRFNSDTRIGSGSAPHNLQVFGTITDGSGNEYSTGSGGGSAITVQEEGTNVGTAAETLNFVGPNITVTGAGSEKTITVLTTEQTGLSGQYPTTGGVAIESTQSVVHPLDVDGSWSTASPNVFGTSGIEYVPATTTSFAEGQDSSAFFRNNTGADIDLTNARMDARITFTALPPDSTTAPSLRVSQDGSATQTFIDTKTSFNTVGTYSFSDTDILNTSGRDTWADGTSLRVWIEEPTTSDTPFTYTVDYFAISFTQRQFERAPVDVVANPAGTTGDALTRISINNMDYNVAGGGLTADAVAAQIRAAAGTGLTATGSAATATLNVDAAIVAFQLFFVRPSQVTTGTTGGGSGSETYDTYIHATFGTWYYFGARTVPQWQNSALDIAATIRFDLAGQPITIA